MVATVLLIGIVVHEAKVDSMLKATIIPVVAFTAELSMSLMRGEAHTHVHSVSLKEISSQTTQLYKRRSLADRYMSKKNLRGRRPNEDYSLSIAA